MKARTPSVLNFPLIGGGMAVLAVKLPLSNENLQRIMDMLETMRPAIVAAPALPIVEVEVEA